MQILLLTYLGTWLRICLRCRSSLCEMPFRQVLRFPAGSLALITGIVSCNTLRTYILRLVSLPICNSPTSGPVGEMLDTRSSNSSKKAMIWRRLSMPESVCHPCLLYLTIMSGYEANRFVNLNVQLLHSSVLTKSVCSSRKSVQGNQVFPTCRQEQP